MRPGKRDLTEPAIVSALQRAGCDIHYVERQPWDILVGRAGQNFALEIKSKAGKLTPAQEKFQSEWRGHYAVVRSVAEALRAVGLPVETWVGRSSLQQAPGP